MYELKTVCSLFTWKKKALVNTNLYISNNIQYKSTN